MVNGIHNDSLWSSRRGKAHDHWQKYGRPTDFNLGYVRTGRGVAAFQRPAVF